MDKTKVGIIAAFIILLASLGIIIKYQHDGLVKQAALEQTITQMKQLNNGVVRDQSQYVTKDDLNAFAKSNGVDLSPIRDDLSKLGAQVQGISNFLVQTPGYNGNNLSSTTTIKRTDTDGPSPTEIPCPISGKCLNTDPFGYYGSAQVLSINEPFADGTNIPFGSTTFKSWLPSPWDLTVYPRTYNVDTVLGQDADGKQYVYNKFNVTTNGKTYPITVQKASFVEQYPSPSFFFSPRLYFGALVGAIVSPIPRAEVTPNLQVALFSYGKTKVDPDWTFLGLGLGYNTQGHNLAIVVSPVNYNVGHHIPLINNLFVGPAITLDTSGGIGVMGGLSVGL